MKKDNARKFKFVGDAAPLPQAPSALFSVVPFNADKIE